MLQKEQQLLQDSRRRRLEHELIEQYLADQLASEEQMNTRYAAGYTGYTEGRMCELFGMNRMQFRTLCKLIKKTEPLTTCGPRLLHCIRMLPLYPEIIEATCEAITRGTAYFASDFRGNKPLTKADMTLLLQQLEAYEQRDFVDEVLQG